MLLTIEALSKKTWSEFNASFEIISTKKSILLHEINSKLGHVKTDAEIEVFLDFSNHYAARELKVSNDFLDTLK